MGKLPKLNKLSLYQDLVKLSQFHKESSSFSIDEPYDWLFCKKMALEYGVSAIPASPFFHDSQAKEDLPMARFAFCKKDETLYEARDRLQGISKLRHSETLKV